VGTKHGNKYHNALLLKQSAAWHTWGQSANLKHDLFYNTFAKQAMR
jgi:hypothetical protein